MIKNIFTRRSIRSFEEGKISRDDFNVIIQAAMNAPTAHNRMEWEFVVIDDENVVEDLKKDDNNLSSKPNLSSLLLICGNKDIVEDEGFLYVDCAAATQNALLAIDEMGLGGCWLAVMPIKERAERLEKTLALPKNFFPVSMIAIGKKAEEKEPNQKFFPEKIHFNRF